MDVSAADGATLHAELDGQESAPVTLVLAHGWTLDATTWGPLVRSQALQGVRVLRYDHRGHGRSAPADPSTMTLEQLADDLAAVIGRLAPDGPLVLGGHSMGGMTIMALAQRHPEVAARAQGIALVATAAGGLAGHTLGLPPRIAAVAASGERRLYASRRWGARPTMGSPRLLAPGVRWLLLGRGADPQARRLTVDAVAGCRPRTAAGFRPTLDAHDRVAALAAFAQTPTVVLAGTRDRLTPVPMARRIVEALPSAQLTVFPGAGHMLPVERVAGVAAQLAALVRGKGGQTVVAGPLVLHQGEAREATPGKARQ
jgi:pimeloyl-ACP methyl ester carboxylesterase